MNNQEIQNKGRYRYLVVSWNLFGFLPVFIDRKIMA